jgi:glycosyltransferase involved in cell wall biosynthesis
LLFLVGFLILVLAVLTRRDLSPLRAFYKLVRRLSGIDLEPHPLPMDAPFSLPSGPPAPGSRLHRPIVLNLATYEGTGQACHPDVVHIPQGFGAGNWRYWMALTPYPHARVRFENPSIYASQDGVNWVVPGHNPVIPAPPGKTDHLSDVDMIFTGGKLRLYYRESLYSRKPSEHTILVTESADGVIWSEARRVLSSRDLLCSPAVVEIDGAFVLWEVSADAIRRRESLDGFEWGSPVVTRVTGLPAGQVPWHLDVVRESEKLHLVLNSRGVAGHRLHYGFSLDGGRSWNVHPYLIERAYGFEWGQHYRATMIAHPDQPGLYQFWYSARSREQVWSIAYIHLIERGNTMIPVDVTPAAAGSSSDNDLFGQGAERTPAAAPSDASSIRDQEKLVSVIIPACNARTTIREALESVRAQTYANLDIVVVDDGSLDGTLGAVEDLAEADARVRLIRRERNGGIPTTRNIGIKESRGVYLSFLDADDLWHPDKIRLQVEKMRQSGPEVAVVYSWCTYMDADTRIIPGRVFTGTFEGDVFTHLLMGNFVNNTWLVRRSCVEAVGGYREDLVTGNEDLQIYLDLAARFDFVVVPEFLTAYRLSPGSKSHDVWNMRLGHRAILERARQEHPTLPAWLFRWSEANQLWFLGFRCLRAGRWAEGFRLLAEAIHTDPGFVLRPTVRKTLVRAVSSKLAGRQNLKPLLMEPGPRRKFLDGGPPPVLPVPQVTSRVERWRQRQISAVSVRRQTAAQVGGEAIRTVLAIENDTAGMFGPAGGLGQGVHQG